MARNDVYAIQSAFIRYLELMYPDLLYTISPAGFIMSAGMAMKMMRMGYRKGTPDLTIYAPRGGYHGLFIEFKDPKGTVSEQQRKFLDQAFENGYATAVCYSCDEAIGILTSYLSSASSSNVKVTPPIQGLKAR
jgi:hypothetical protein